jgi:hypothetical protein
MLVAPAANTSNTSAVARAVMNRERLGQASRLTASIRKQLSRPNLIVQIDRQWLESQFNRDVSEAYPVDNVFAGTRSVGGGQLVGTLRAQVLPSNAVGRCLLRFSGTSTARTRGTQDGVRVVSRGTTRVTATQPFRLDARGMTLDPARADAVTNIVYESIDSAGLQWRQRRAVSETYARRPRAERESAAYARSSILQRINDQAQTLAGNFNVRYRTVLRDPRLTALRPAAEVRVRVGADDVRWECLLAGRESFGAPAEPPQVATHAQVVFHLAASAIEEQAAVELAGRELSGEQLMERIGGMGRMTQPSPQSGQEAMNVSFAEDPCDVYFAEGLVHVRLFVTKFDSADVQYPAMIVDVAYQPTAPDGRLLLVRQGRVRVTPRATDRGEDGPRVSGRQQTLRLAVERKLASVFPEQLENTDIELPLAGDRPPALRIEQVRIEGPWLQLVLGGLQ